jgi:hypothetical protein
MPGRQKYNHLKQGRRKPKFKKLASAVCAAVIGYFSAGPSSLPSIKSYLAVREVMAEPTMKELSKDQLEAKATQAIKCLKEFILHGKSSERDKFIKLWNDHSSNNHFFNKFQQEMLGQKDLGLRGKILGNPLIKPLLLAYYRHKKDLDPKSFAIAFAECYDFINQASGHKTHDQLQKAFGSFFTEFLKFKRGTYGYAASNLIDYAASGDKKKLNAFMRSWRVAVPDYSKLGKAERKFIEDLQKALEKKSPQLGRAAIDYARKKRTRYLDFAQFASAITGARADLKKYKPDAIKKWMNKKYTEPLLKYVASLSQQQKAKEAVTHLEKFLHDPKSAYLRSRFALSFKGADAGFYLAFHSQLRRSRVRVLFTEYEKKMGPVFNQRSANTLALAVSVVYEELKSSKPDPSRFYLKYGRAFVGVVKGGITIAVPKKLHKAQEVKAELDRAQEKLEYLEKYFKQLKMNRDPAVRARMDYWSDRLYLLRGRLKQEKMDFNVLYKFSFDFKRDIPSEDFVKMVLKTAEMDLRNINRVYYGKKRYSYTITKGWISRMESLLSSIDATRQMTALTWFYDSYVAKKAGSINTIRNNVHKLKGAVNYIESVLSNLTNLDERKNQLTTISNGLDQLSLNISPDFKDTLMSAITDSAKDLETLTLDSAVFWNRELGRIISIINRLPVAFRERVAIQFYSRWHEETSSRKGYLSLPAAIKKIIPSVISFKRAISAILPYKTIEYEIKPVSPGMATTFATKTLNTKGEVYNDFRTLPIETQYEIGRLFQRLYGANPTLWDNTTWTRFAATVEGMRDIPGSHGGLLLKRLGSKLLKYDPTTISAVLGTIAGYSRVFYPGGHYRELSAYYESLPPKLEKIFTDIFPLKDQIKEEYRDVRIIKPTEQNQFYSLFFPAANIVVQIPKHVYQQWTSGGFLITKIQAAKVAKAPAAPPNIPRTERRFFTEKAIEGRLMIPNPAIVPILALNKLNQLAPNYIPEVGEWYQMLVNQTSMTAWEKMKRGDVTQKTWQTLSTTRVGLTGEGKNATADYTLRRGSKTTSLDEGRATFRNLSFNENRLPNAWLIDLEEFKAKAKSKTQQTRVWSRLSDRISARVIPLVEKPAPPKSAQAKAVATILDNVTAIRLAAAKEEGRYNVSVLSDRGTISSFTSSSNDFSSKEFQDDFWNSLRAPNFRSTDFRRLRKQRLGKLADALHDLRRFEEKGSKPLAHTDAAKLIGARFRKLEEQTVRDMLSSLGSIYMEPVKVAGRKQYFVEIRVGTTAIFNFTTPTSDVSSAQFRKDFWNKFGSVDIKFTSGLLSGRAQKDFLNALSTFNSLPTNVQDKILARKKMEVAVSNRLKMIAIPLSKGKRKVFPTKELAGRILDKITIKEYEPAKYRVYAGELKHKIVIGEIKAYTQEELKKKFAALMYKSEPDEIKRKGLSGIPGWAKFKRKMFGPGRNAVDGEFYIRRYDDRITRITTGIRAMAPGGADSAVYFDRVYQGTVGEGQAKSVISQIRWQVSAMNDKDFNDKIVKPFQDQIAADKDAKKTTKISELKVSDLFKFSDSDKASLDVKMSLQDLLDVIQKARSELDSDKKVEEWDSTKMLRDKLVDDKHLYTAYMFKRLEGGSFVLMDVRTLTNSQAKSIYMTIKPAGDLSYKLYSRLHPVMGKGGEAELENCTIFAADEEAMVKGTGDQKRMQQGLGAAYQNKIFGEQLGAYGLGEWTRGGRASFGAGWMDPEKRRYAVGRMFFSNLEEKEIRSTRTGQIEKVTGYHVQGTFVQANYLRADMFVGKQNQFEAAGIFDMIADSAYFGAGALAIKDRVGYRGYIMDRNLVNAAVFSGLHEKGHLQAMAGGGRLVLSQLNLELKAGGLGRRGGGKGGFWYVTYRPDQAFLSFNKFTGMGMLVRGEGKMNIAGLELAGRVPKWGLWHELDAYHSIGKGAAGELKLHFSNLDITLGGAGAMETIAKKAVWAGVRGRWDSATLFGVVSLGEELPTEQEEEQEPTRSIEFMAGGRLRLSDRDYKHARTWYGIAGFSGIIQDIGQQWGRQFDFQLGALGQSFYDNWMITAGAQKWENADRIRDSLTFRALYDRKLAWWVFRDMTLSTSLAIGRDLTKSPEWSRAFVQFMLNFRGSF